MEPSMNRRPWEEGAAKQQQHHDQPQQSLPSISTLTANLTNGPPPTVSEISPINSSISQLQRDSGNWSMPQSTRELRPAILPVSF